MNHDELVERLQRRADKRGVSCRFPPLTAGEIARCEKELGLTLLDLVKRVYRSVANGC